LVGKWLKLHPVEAAILTGAAKRMQPMPFALIATRIGGVLAVTRAGLLYRRFL
jgi:Na+/citrate or Na+/malate symporter